mgnify:FL=1
MTACVGRLSPCRMWDAPARLSRPRGIVDEVCPCSETLGGWHGGYRHIVQRCNPRATRHVRLERAGCRDAQTLRIRPKDRGKRRGEYKADHQHSVVPHACTHYSKSRALATKLIRQLDIRHRDGWKKDIQAHRKRLDVVQCGSHSMSSLVEHLRRKAHGHEGRGVSQGEVDARHERREPKGRSVWHGIAFRKSGRCTQEQLTARH